MKKQLDDLSIYLRTNALDAGIISTLREAIALGDIPGARTFDKFGRSALLPASGVPGDVWEKGGIYAGFPTGPGEEMEVYSNNVNDTVAGTGARTVLISNLLDEEGEERDPVLVEMDGTTPVSLGPLKYTRCTRMQVVTAGTGGGNAGVITVRHKVTVANIFGTIAVGKNQTNILAYTVPAGKTLFITRANVFMSRLNGADGSAEVEFRVRDFGPDRVFNVYRNPDISNSQDYNFGEGELAVVSSRTDFVVRVPSVSDQNTTVAGEIDGFLIERDTLEVIS